MNISVIYSQAHYREILAANDAHQVCHSGHLDMHVCVFVCAVLFMLLFSLRDRRLNSWKQIKAEADDLD